jgi:hypothetical protein
MKAVFQPEWRTQNRLKRRFYAKYIAWLEWIGYLVVIAVVAAFLFAFNYRVDDLVTADAVKLTPFSTPVKSTDTTQVVRAFRHDFDEVRVGEPLVEVVEGAAAIQAYGRWEKVDGLKVEVGNSPELVTLEAKYPKPATRIIKADRDGTFRLDPKTTIVDPKTEICRVVDYSDIRLSASLTGDTIPKAAVGQMARLSNLDLGSSTGTLVRAKAPQGTLLSNQILSPEVKEQLAGQLKGMAVKFRDDLPLAISDVTEIQVDTNVNAATASGGAAVPLAPSPSFALQAAVVEGTPSATAQVADLPPALQQRLIGAVQKSVNDKAVKNLDGTQWQLSQSADVHLLLKLKATDLAAPGAVAIAGTPIKRTFEATLKVQSPPAFLIQALRDADRNGKDVTARVELRTGSRPIAFILLKKS